MLFAKIQPGSLALEFCKSTTFTSPAFTMPSHTAYRIGSIIRMVSYLLFGLNVCPSLGKVTLQSDPQHRYLQ